MLRQRYRGTTLWARRVAFMLALSLSAMGIVFVASAAPAQACSWTVSPNMHCYAEAVANDTTTNYGMAANIESSCLHVTNDGNSATQEIWDVSSGTNYWEELGILSGIGYGTNSYYSNKTWFWAENTSDDGYTEMDDPQGVASAGTNIYYPVELTYSGGDWLAYGGNSEELLVESADQEATLIQGIAGTEYTSYGGNDTRDAGNIDALARESTAGNWYTWGNATQENFGPNYYIIGSYGSAAEEWDWSC